MTLMELSFLNRRVKHFESLELSIIKLVWFKFVIGMIIWSCGFLIQNFFFPDQNSKLYPNFRKVSPYILFSTIQQSSPLHFGQKFYNSIWFFSPHKLIFKRVPFSKKFLSQTSSLSKKFLKRFISYRWRKPQWKERLPYLSWKENFMCFCAMW